MLWFHSLKRSVFRQFVAIGAAYLIVLSTVTIVVIESGLTFLLEDAETQFVNKDMDRLVSTLEDKKHELEKSMTIFSTWDDAWQFMHSHDSAFTQTNFQPGTMTKAGVEFMTFWSPQGELIYGAYEHRSQQMFGKIPLWLQSALEAQLPECLGHVKSLRNETGFITSDQEPILITIQPIVHTNGSGPAQGLLIAGYRLEQNHEIKEISSVLNTQFQMERIDPLQRPVAQPVINRLNEVTLNASQVIQDIHNQYSLRVTMTQPRAYFLQGKQNLHVLLAIVIGLSAILFAASFGILDKRFIHRIRRLSNGVKSVSMGADPKTLPHSVDGDELDSLMREVKTLFKNLFDQQRELVDARLQAESANLAKRQFLARMSHEIRTPLNGVIGTASLLNTTPLNEEQQEYLEMIQSSSSLLLELVNDILDFEKIESGKIELESIEFNLEKEIQEIIHIVQPRIASKNVGFYVYLAPDTPQYVKGDAYRLRQILVNLLSNATKFTQTGHIFLSIEYLHFADTQHQPFFTFVVEDTGLGIEKVRQNAIFKEFEQADTSISRQFGGSGLGLAICKQLAEMMGGELGVESEPGRGSRFWFNVPLEVNLVDQPDAPNTHELPKTVLVLQNQPIPQAIFCRYLKKLGVQCYCASTVAEAEGYMTSHPAESQVSFVCDASWLASNDREEELMGFYTRYFNHQPWVIISTSQQRPTHFPPHSIWLTRPVLPNTLRRTLQRLTVNPNASLTDNTNSEAPELLKEIQTRASLRILAVEDNLINQKVLERMLSKEGHTVVLANHGQEALEILARETFDIILMDCHMPIMDGFEATVKIRSSGQAYAQIPIIAVTGNAIASELEKCLACGMNDTVTKPIQKESLLEKLYAFV